MSAVDVTSLPVGTVVEVRAGPLKGTYTRTDSVFEAEGFDDPGAQRWVSPTEGEIDGNGVAWCLEEGHATIRPTSRG